jgi:hypothetical protein
MAFFEAACYATIVHRSRLRPPSGTGELVAIRYYMKRFEALGRKLELDCEPGEKETAS